MRQRKRQVRWRKTTGILHASILTTPNGLTVARRRRNTSRHVNRVAQVRSHRSGPRPRVPPGNHGSHQLGTVDRKRSPALNGVWAPVTIGVQVELAADAVVVGITKAGREEVGVHDGVPLARHAAGVAEQSEVRTRERRENGAGTHGRDGPDLLIVGVTIVYHRNAGPVIKRNRVEEGVPTITKFVQGNDYPDSTPGVRSNVLLEQAVDHAAESGRSGVVPVPIPVGSVVKVGTIADHVDAGLGASGTVVGIGDVDVYHTGSGAFIGVQDAVVIVVGIDGIGHVIHVKVIRGASALSHQSRCGRDDEKVDKDKDEGRDLHREYDCKKRVVRFTTGVLKHKNHLPNDLRKWWAASTSGAEPRLITVVH